MQSCARPCPAPDFSPAAWPETVVFAEGLSIALRVPPALGPHPMIARDTNRRTSERSFAVSGSNLIESWTAKSPFGVRLLAIWTDRIATYEVMTPPRDWKPERIEFSTCAENVAGVEVGIATWITTMGDIPPAYDVAAHWPIVPGVWAKFVARSYSRSEQEEILVTLRTLRMTPM